MGLRKIFLNVFRINRRIYDLFAKIPVHHGFATALFCMLYCAVTVFADDLDKHCITFAEVFSPLLPLIYCFSFDAVISVASVLDSFECESSSSMFTLLLVSLF